MGYMNREDRLTLVGGILEFVSSSPKTNSEIINQLKLTKEITTYLCKKLLRAGLLVKNSGERVTYSRTDKQYDDRSLRKAMGYNIADEVVYVECTLCEESKPRITKREGKKTRNTSPDGRVWSGRRCPDCLADSYTKLDTIQMTTKKCREEGCNNFLPATRYFKCLDCQPELPSVNDDFIYHTAAASVGALMELDGQFFDTDTEFNSKRWGKEVENEETENDEDE